MFLGHRYTNILLVAGRPSILPPSSYYGIYIGSQGPKVGHMYSRAYVYPKSRASTHPCWNSIISIHKVSTLNENVRIKHTARKYHGPLGFMVYDWVMLCTVVTVIIRTLIPINPILVLCFSAAYPVEAYILL